MQVTVKLFAGLRQGRFRADNFEFKPGTNVDQVAQQHKIPYSEIGILICNGRHVGLDYVLAEGDVLSIFPKVGGG
jgi:molybdopterin converting factor small subunit